MKKFKLFAKTSAWLYALNTCPRVVAPPGGHHCDDATLQIQTSIFDAGYLDYRTTV